ncbi:MAG: hypothetical protein IPF79_05685 [Ignavibacteria bacterium]|nr:hypothetical protein [Ignavibacteria bacterium]
MTKTPFTSFFTAMMMALAAHPMAACKPDTEMAISRTGVHKFSTGQRRRFGEQKECHNPSGQ